MKPDLKLRALFLLNILIATLAVNSQYLDVTSEKNFSIAKSGPIYGSGVAAADYDGDGDIDLYVCTEEGHANYLYRNDLGNFTSIGEEVGLASMERSRMALWIDIDGDHDLDLLVAGDCDQAENDCSAPGQSQLNLYRHDDGVFTDITIQARLHLYGPKRKREVLGGLAAGDINNDGYVDFVVAMWNGQMQTLINDGTGAFDEQSVKRSLDVGVYNYWQPVFHDFNKDGYLDIYCNVDFSGNKLWISSPGGHFVDLSEETKSDNAFNEMGISLGDIDNDGDFDIYATNIANHNGFDVHNILLMQNRSGNDEFHFEENAKGLGLDQGGWGWGTTMFDSNNDGLLDLAATNGWYTKDPDLSRIWIQQPDGSFLDQSESLNLNDTLNGTTLISIDYDRDGDLDVVQSIKDFDEEIPNVRLLENQLSATDGNYLVVKPRMNGPNHFSIGATVTAYADEQLYTRLIHAGTSFYGQEPAEAFFGLGSNEILDSLKITWPGGESSWWYDISTNQVLVLNDDQVVHRPVELNAEQGINKVVLTWRDVSTNETGFLLQRSPSPKFEPVEEFQISAGETSFSDTRELIDGTYYYRISSFNASYSSRFTSVVEIDNVVLSSVEDQIADIDVFPNPTVSSVRVLSVQKINFIALFSVDGTMINFHNYMPLGSNSGILDVTKLRRGVYLLMVNSEVKKIVIQ